MAVIVRPTAGTARPRLSVALVLALAASMFVAAPRQVAALDLPQDEMSRSGVLGRADARRTRADQRHKDRARERARALRIDAKPKRAKGEPPAPPMPSAAPSMPKQAAPSPTAPPPTAKDAAEDQAEQEGPQLGQTLLRGDATGAGTIRRSPDQMPNPNLAPRPAPLPGLPPDHTVASVKTIAELQRLCSIDGGPLACKLTITGLGTADVALHLYDPRFYAYHDEWMWMHQLAGDNLVGAPPGLVAGKPVPTVADAYRAMAALAVMPLGLSWIQGRLYSDRFYDLAARPGSTANPRRWIAATLRYLPAEPKRRRSEALWLVELEETDSPTELELQQLVQALRATLPAEVGAALQWLVRPAAGQEAAAARIQGKPHVLADRLVRYDELIVPGRATPYTLGVTAGWLRLIRRGEDAMGVAGPDDIVLLEQLPDALPPVAGIVTLHEQAAQAHVNLLAAARGTPNAAAPDLVLDPTTRALAQRDAPVALLVSEAGVQLKPLLPEQWARWRQRNAPLPAGLMPYDPRGDAYVYDLSPGASATIAGSGKPTIAGFAAGATPTTGLIGGKAYGLWHLLRSPIAATVATPPRPLVLSTRCYAETVAPLEGAIFEVINDAAVLQDRRVRILALQGQKGFDAWHQPGTEAHRDAQRWLAAFRKLPQSAALRQAIAAGGLQEMVRRRPLSAGCRATALPAIAAHVHELAPTQGLRFRSSSSVEDLPGFNGAGLYRSVTGWVDPTAATPAKPGKKRRSMEAAISEVFASYWSFEAFEEREAAAIWHLDGAMAVVVHPRFDDDKERANGVVLARVRDQAGTTRSVEVEVNAQAGATSVTNARGEAGGRPYIVRLRRAGDAPFAIERVSAADVARPDALNDATLLALASSAEAAATDQLARERRAAAPQRQPLSTVADLEFRLVADGWPSRRDGAIVPGRMVLKQLRPLSRPTRIDLDLLDQRLRQTEGVPTDVAPYAERVVRRSCLGAGFRLTAILVDLDAGAPMRAAAELAIATSVELSGRAWGRRLKHQGVAQSSEMHREAAGLRFVVADSAPSVDAAIAFVLADDGGFALSSSQRPEIRGKMRCNDHVLAATESVWLRALFAPTGAPKRNDSH